MVAKIAKAVWFLSLLGALAVLLITYASFPDQVVVRQDASRLVSLPRDTVFYIALALMTVANTLVYSIGKIFSKNEAFRTWFNLFVVTLNIFFVVALNLLSEANSLEHFDYNRINFIVYGSVILVVLAAATWPFYLLYRKISHK